MLLHLKIIMHLALAASLFTLTSCSEPADSQDPSSVSESSKNSSIEIRLLSVRADDFIKTTLVEYNGKEIVKIMELFEYVNTVNKAYKKYEAEGFNIRKLLREII